MVDLQNDFCEGGSLAVPFGNEVVAIANALQAHFDLIVATKDWHPKDHLSFASNHPGKKVGELIQLLGESQVLWPDHCVQQSAGADFHPDLKTDNINKIIYKGSIKTLDSYSAFFDNAHIHATGLEDYLRSQQITDVYIMGLATDYCVKFSALDCIQLGFNVYVIEDACRGIDLNSGDVANALAEMEAAGVQIIHYQDIR